jgi:non-canonical (house-cleaning) NTP pyrophosphatase
MNKVLLTSTSPIKIKALQNVLGPGYVIEDHDTSACGNPEQPVGATESLICCKRRIEWLLKELNGLSPEFHSIASATIYSIESGIERVEIERVEGESGPVDVVHVLIYNNGVYTYSRGATIKFPLQIWDLAKEESRSSELGWSVTVGEVISRGIPQMDAKNWMLKTSGIDRTDQITGVVQQAVEAFCLSDLHSIGAITPSSLMANVRYVISGNTELIDVYF